jgi:hypothetical protein
LIFNGKKKCNKQGCIALAEVDWFVTNKVVLLFFFMKLERERELQEWEHLGSTIFLVFSDPNLLL